VVVAGKTPAHTYSFFFVVEADTLERDHIVGLSVLGLVDDTVGA